jgi:DNA-binding SARP family transcriptional activator
MNSSGASIYEIELLGGLAVRKEAADLTSGLGGKVGRLAFAYLVLHRDRAVRRDELAAAIWEESAPENPDAALRVVLSRLRSALGRDALAGRAELRLELDGPVEVDLERLRELVAQAERNGGIDGATEAARLANEELAPGLEADWLTAVRDELAELRVRALTALGNSALTTSIPQALEAARQMVAIAPYRESGYRLLIEALAASGDTAEALRTYEQLRVLLRDELGTQPSRDLSELHMELLRSGDEKPESEILTAQLPLPIPATPVGNPALQGRTEELAQLRNGWQAARKGAFTEILVGGDPGIGKSRLAAEAARAAHADGGNVLWGRCHEEALVPYEPFVEALRQLVAPLDADQLAELAHRAGADFLSLAPELARRLPRGAIGQLADDPQSRRYQLFESVAEALTLAAQARPTMLVVEDLHWADQSTLLLLAHLRRRASAAPLLVVGTFRTTELSPENAFAPAIELGGLTAQDTAEIIAELAPGRELETQIYAETEGNPLFIVELLRSLIEEQQHEKLPAKVNDVIDQRLRRLSADAATVLGVGAVLGRSFELELVGRVSGLDRARLIDATEEAIGARLIEEVSGDPGRVQFTHALIREVRYRQHSAARRAALHDAAAEAIRAVHGDELDEHLAELATHLEAAARDRDSARVALEALRQAGEQAASRNAFEDAVALLRRARSQFNRAAPSDVARCDVTLRLAESLRAADAIPEAREVAAEAAALARALDDPERLSRAAIASVGSHLVFKAGRPDAEDIALLDESAARLPESPQLVRLLARLATAIYYSDRFDEVPEIAARADEIAHRLNDPTALGWAIYTRFWAALRPDGYHEAMAAVDQLTDLFSRTNSVELIGESKMVRWHALLRQGRPDLVARNIEEERESIIASGIPIHRWFMEAVSATVAVTQGHQAEAERMIGQVAAAGAAIDPHDLPRFAAIPLLQLRIDQGRLPELLETLRGVVAANPGLPVWRGILLQAMVTANEHDAAVALLGELARENFAWLRRDVNWMWAITSISTACVALGERDTAEILYGLLAELPAQSVVAGPALGFYGPVHRYLGGLAGVLGRPRDAADHFDAALAELDRAGAWPLATATRRDYARMLLQHNLVADARRVASEAKLEADELKLKALSADAARIIALAGERD